MRRTRNASPQPPPASGVPHGSRGSIRPRLPGLSPCPRGPLGVAWRRFNRAVEERPMRRAGKRVKAKDGAKLPAAKRSQSNESSRVRDLEKRLAEALKSETEALEREREALEQQTATADILRVISGSPTNVQPVFDAIVKHAGLLCGCVHTIAVRLDGNMVILA